MNNSYGMIIIRTVPQNYIIYNWLLTGTVNDTTTFVEVSTAIRDPPKDMLIDQTELYYYYIYLLVSIFISWFSEFSVCAIINVRNSTCAFKYTVKLTNLIFLVTI